MPSPFRPPARRETSQERPLHAVVSRSGAAGSWALLLAAGLLASRFPGTTLAEPGDVHASLPRAPHGSRFAFEIIESHDAKYLGDTPGHMGRDGGLEVRPNVAIGDPVHRTEAGGDRLVGRVTAVVWERVSRSLTVEFDPEPFLRIAVGDEVWIDLNPSPPASAAPAAGGPSPAAR